MKQNKPPPKKRSRGRPKLAISKTRLECQCGGASGKGMCKKGIDCDECNQCERACKVVGKCEIVGPPKKKPAQTRITTGVAVHKPNLYADPGDDIAESKRQKEMSMVKHVALSLPSARVTDLAKAFGRQKFFIPSALTTINELRKSMPTSSIDNDSAASASASIDSEDKLRPLLTILKYVMNTTVKVLAGGEHEAKQLKSIYISEEFDKWEHSTLLENTRKIITNTPTLHDAHRVLRAVFTESMGENTAAKYHLGSRRSITRAKKISNR